MQTIYDPAHIQHDPDRLDDLSGPSLPLNEVPQRALIIHAAIEAAGFGPVSKPRDFGRAPLAAVHTPGLLEFLETAYASYAAEVGGPRPLVAETFAMGQTGEVIPDCTMGRFGVYAFGVSAPIMAHTWTAAYRSAQVALSAAAVCLAGESTVYALCRPPGHHAAASQIDGYCYLNNAAIAAEWLAQQGQRVAIVDIDYHHGNGTQAIFYQRPDVLVCSLHADPAREYPYFWGYAAERGVGPGAGANHNFPLPFGVTETAYLAVLDEALVLVRRFKPNSLLISLGLDTYFDDPETKPKRGFALQTTSYALLGARFAALALPTVVVQEGGYHLASLGANVVSFLDGLLNG